MEIIENNANDCWLQLLNIVVKNGRLTLPRGYKCLEHMNVHTEFPMSQPIVTCSARKLGYKFMYAEAFFILSGGFLVSDIAPWSKKISNYSDDGVTFFGAYGPKVQEQLQYVVQTLFKDPWSRQAVMTIWRENPPPTKDVPCTISIQFLIRDNKLHCIDNMRSSDLWMGFPYDVFNFSMLSSMVILDYYQLTGVHLELGNLYMNLGSAHIYSQQFDDVHFVLTSPEGCEEKFNYFPIDPVRDYGETDNLLKYLYIMRDKGVDNG